MYLCCIVYCAYVLCLAFVFVFVFVFVNTCVSWSHWDQSPFLYLQIPSPLAERLLRTNTSSVNSWFLLFQCISSRQITFKRSLSLLEHKISFYLNFFHMKSLNKWVCGQKGSDQEWEEVDYHSHTMSLSIWKISGTWNQSLKVSVLSFCYNSVVVRLVVDIVY